MSDSVRLVRCLEYHSDFCPKHNIHFLNDHFFNTVTKLITSVLFLLLLINQPSRSLCKGDDGIAITLHRNEESLHAGGCPGFEPGQRIQETRQDGGSHQGSSPGIVEWGASWPRQDDQGKGKRWGVSFRSQLQGYSVKFSLGTPAQELLLIMDTGSNLVWVPSTRNYTCIHCPVDSASNGVSFPRMSASLHLVTCADPNWETLFGQNTELVCQSCTGSLKKLH